LVKPFNGKRLLAFNGKGPIGKKIVLVDFNPRHYKFVIGGRKSASQQFTFGMEYVPTRPWYSA
jgi:hypothetical protein